MHSKVQPKVRALGLGYLQINDPPEPSGSGFPVVTLPSGDKNYPVTGQTNGGKLIDSNKIWCKDNTDPAHPLAEVQGTSATGSSFTFAANKVPTDYGLRTFHARADFTVATQPPTDDDDDQQVVVMPPVLKVDFTSNAAHNLANNGCGTCTNANTYFNLDFGIGPNQATWKWGAEISTPICDAAFLSVVITTGGSTGGLTFTIKSGNFSTQGSFGKYYLSNWDYKLPVTVPHVSGSGNCTWGTHVVISVG